MNSEQKKLDLIRRYFDGTITPDDMRVLQELLRTEPAVRRLFARYANLDAALPKRVQQAAPIVTRTPRAQWRRQWLPLAAAVVLLAAGAALWWSGDRKDNNGSGPVAAAQVGNLAVVSDQSPDARWSGVGAPGGTGHAVAAGRYQLAQGSARLRLDNGVDLLLTGPADLELRSADYGLLHRGRLAARVPPQAIGFRVDAAKLRVVDLGTEFGLTMDDTDRPGLHVFEGKVEASVVGGRTARLELKEGQTTRLDRLQTTLEPQPFEAVSFPKLPAEAGVPQTTGSVRFLHTPPASLGAGEFEHDYILVFAEQQNLVLSRGLNVVASEPGEYPRPDVPRLPPARLRQGTRVSSYMVHYDRPRHGAASHSSGSITFDRPILGVIAGGRALAESDALLGVSTAIYEPSPQRVLELSGPPEIVDSFTLSADRRTLSLRWHITAYVDELRVLVAAPEKEPGGR